MRNISLHAHAGKMEVFVPMKKTEVSNVPVQLAIQVWYVLGKVIVYVKFTNTFQPAHSE
jgi:hypothetical protein